MRRRVVITGIGCVTPLGNNPAALWQGLMRGESGVGYTTLFDATNFPTRISAQVKDYSVADVGEDPEAWKHQGRHARFAVGAARQAMRDAGLEQGCADPTRMGVYLGSGEGNQDFDRFTQMMLAGIRGPNELDVGAFTQKALEILDPLVELEQEPNMTASHLAGLFNAQGPNINCLTACAASSQAIGEATELIRRGDVDAMISGGTHSMIHVFGVTGFSVLTALSTRNDEPKRASRPFDKDRDGFVLGEGSGIVVLEELEHAKKRGARIYAEITGYGSTADAFRITDTHPEGRGAVSCMKMAIQDAGLNLDEIHYINAHGTSTSVNDKVESLAVKKVFGDRAYQVPVSSTKSMTGHLIAAAGATELIICLMAMREGVLPPTINYETPDPDCDLDYVPNQPRPATIDNACSNSFGFGGQNISLIASKFRG